MNRMRENSSTNSLSPYNNNFNRKPNPHLKKVNCLRKFFFYKVILFKSIRPKY
jgi:hypothetical protein